MANSRVRQSSKATKIRRLRKESIGLVETARCLRCAVTYLQSIAAKSLTSFSSYTTGNAIRHCCLCGLGGDVNACFTQQCCSSRKLQCDWLDTKTQQKKNSTAKTLFCIQAVEVTVCLVFFFLGGGGGHPCYMLHGSVLTQTLHLSNAKY